MQRLQQRKLRLPVPTHIITGALGSGKTTAIAALLAAKPEDEFWCLLSNEVGAVGVDAALLSAGLPSRSSSGTDGGVAVRELAGGCMCCALSGVTGVAIAQLVRQAKPSRLLIEPSGLAHPAALVDILTGPSLRSALSLQPIVCLVDATRFAAGTDGIGEEAGPLFHDQVSIADVVVGSKADACDPGTLQRFSAWAQELFPPKKHVGTCAHGRLDPAWLGINGGSSGRDSGGAAAGTVAGAAPASSTGLLGRALARPGAASGSVWLSNTPAAAVQAQQPAPGRPLRKVALGGSTAASGRSGPTTCGWEFDAGDTFDRQRLQALLDSLAAAPCVLRLKGVFRVGTKSWVAANHVASAVGAASSAAAGSAACTTPASAPSSSSSSSSVALPEIAYRGGSRMELIVTAATGGSLEDGAGAAEQATAGGELAAAEALRQGDWEALERSLLLMLKPAAPS